MKITLVWLLSMASISAAGQPLVREDTLFTCGRTHREIAYQLLIGFHLQGSSRNDPGIGTRKYAEIGLHRTLTGVRGPHPPGGFTYGFSTEVLLDKHPIYGVKVGTWASAMLLGLGLQAIYYTDFREGNFKIRPEFGIGTPSFKLSFGYNIPMPYNQDFARMRYADLHLSLQGLLKLKTIKKE